jgi:hypothetical protein
MKKQVKGEMHTWRTIIEAIEVKDLDRIAFSDVDFDHDAAEEECRSEIDYSEIDEDEIDNEVEHCVLEKMRKHAEIGAKENSFSVGGRPFKVVFTPEKFTVGSRKVDVYHVAFTGPSDENLSNLSGALATKVYEQVIRAVVKFAASTNANGFIIGAHSTATYGLYDRLITAFMPDFTLVGLWHADELLRHIPVTGSSRAHENSGNLLERVYLRNVIADEIKRNDPSEFSASTRIASSERDSQLEAASIEKNLARAARRAAQGLVGKVVPVLSDRYGAALLKKVGEDLSFQGTNASKAPISGQLHLDVPLPFHMLGARATQADIDRLVSSSDPADESLFPHLALLRMGFSNIKWRTPSRGRLDKAAYERDKREILGHGAEAQRNPGSFSEWLHARECRRS